MPPFRGGLLRLLLAAALFASSLTGVAVTTVADSSPAQASTQQVFDGPNDNVEAIAVGADGTAYVGGSFTAWGPQTGGGALLDRAAATVDRTFPPVKGRVYTAVSDGAGGWYIGGEFLTVGETYSQNLAHILSSGIVDPTWNDPFPNGAVRQIVVHGSTLYVAGEFTSIAGATRNRLAAFDSSGTLTPWDPNANGTVNALAVKDDTIYAGGTFTTVSSTTRNRLAAITTNGTLTPWDPNANNTVNALAIKDDTIYAGGGFTTVSSTTRNRLAAITTNGTLTPWDPNANNTVHGLAVGDDTVYVAGDFTSASGLTRRGFAAVTASGIVAPWDPGALPSAPSGGGRVVAAAGSFVYAGGTFTIMGGVVRNRLAAVASDGTLTSWNPNAGGTVNALAVKDDTIYAGGAFTTVSSTPRNNLAAITTSGTLTSWNPNANSTVYALAVKDDTIYAGGAFSNVSGTPRNRLAAITTSGTLTSWNPNAGGTVEALAVKDDTIYVGGFFTSVSSTPRGRLAAITTSGTLTSWNPNANGTVYALAVKDDTIYAGGAFTTVSSTTRGRLAAITTNGTLTPWNPTANSTVNALAANDRVLYVAGAFTSIAGTLRNRLVAFDSTGTLTSWNPNANNTVNALAVRDQAYVGGAFGRIATGLTGGGEYFARVVAVASAPNAPGRPTAVAGNAGATVTVTPPLSGPTPTSYTVTAAPDGASCLVSGASGSCPITGLTNGQAYTFTSTATNATGTSSASLASSPITPAAVAPSAPTGLAASPGNGSASITFTPGADGGSPITNYAYTLDDSTWIPLAPDDTTSPVTITGLANGITYSIKLRAINVAGNGASSDPVSVTPQAPLPPVPPRPAPAMSPTSQTITGTAGTPITATSTFTLENFTLIPRYTVYPALPTGLSIDPATGIVSGTPAEAYPSTRHWITATAGGNSESAYSTLQVTIDPAPTPTITIVGTRSANGARIEVTGTSTHLAGATLTPWFQFAGQTAYTQGKITVTVASDGTFTWTRKTNKQTNVYFTHDSTESNTVVIAARTSAR